MPPARARSGPGVATLRSFFTLREGASVRGLGAHPRNSHNTRGRKSFLVPARTRLSQFTNRKREIRRQRTLRAEKFAAGLNKTGTAGLPT